MVPKSSALPADKLGADTIDEERLQAKDRAAWRALYADAPDAAAIWRPLPFMESFIGWIGPLPGLPLVDLACGDGGQIAAMPPDLAVIGIDQSLGALERARRLLAGREGSCTLLPGRLEALPLADEIAGGAVMIDVLCGFLDPGPILREAFRILAPGAALGVTTFAPGDPLAMTLSARAGKPVWVGDFINVFYEAGQVGNLLEEAGFEIERAETRCDQELPHPGFREEAHGHERAILVARKPERVRRTWT